MKITNQSNAGLTRLGELIADIPVAMLTTFDAHVALISQPMSPLEMDADGAIWFFINRYSTKAEHLHVLNLSFADHAHASYVSLSGGGEINLDYARIEHLWTPLAKPWFPDGMDSPDLALLKFVPHTAEYWDAPHSKMVRMFALAASVLAAKPIGLGEHDKLTALSNH